ncbi:uncharacterized protein CLUP02_03954 [Colletotrichum lupini]|uniref:Uncharacterized protein n=1 Tax=Colletotrichum lupini TaxID=145971 RepID=A0A9Q8SJC7_9PEZI|nr:uncharacterized protein CLUP02_03954 [Colletotrichum lupini]UQC78477.1 hypothetical protein CLUP02_03954 [Colletotrichum lupini]
MPRTSSTSTHDHGNYTRETFSYKHYAFDRHLNILGNSHTDISMVTFLNRSVFPLQEPHSQQETASPLNNGHHELGTERLFTSQILSSIVVVVANAVIVKYTQRHIVCISMQESFNPSSISSLPGSSPRRERKLPVLLSVVLSCLTAIRHADILFLSTNRNTSVDNSAHLGLGSRVGKKSNPDGRATPDLRTLFSLTHTSLSYSLLSVPSSVRLCTAWVPVRPQSDPRKFIEQPIRGELHSFPQPSLPSISFRTGTVSSVSRSRTVVPSPERARNFGKPRQVKGGNNNTTTRDEDPKEDTRITQGQGANTRHTADNDMELELFYNPTDSGQAKQKEKTLPARKWQHIDPVTDTPFSLSIFLARYICQKQAKASRSRPFPSIKPHVPPRDAFPRVHDSPCDLILSVRHPGILSSMNLGPPGALAHNGRQSRWGEGGPLPSKAEASMLCI